MAKRITDGKDGNGGTTLSNVLEDDFGLTRDVPERARYINPEGAAIASRGQIELWKRSFFEGVATLARVRQGADVTAGEILHNVGTSLREIRGHSAWKTLGIDSWETFCQEQLRISPRHANRIVAFAGAVTHEQAAFGVRKCLAGIRLAERLGLEGLGALILDEGEPEPPEWAKVLGEPVRFTRSSALRLERLAAARKTPALPPVKASRRVAALVVARTAVIGAVTRKHEALSNLEVKSFAKDGEARVTHGSASSAAEMFALSQLYAALAKT